MTMDETTDGNTDLKDRSAGLIALGIVQILIGALCALAVPLMLLATVVPMALEEGTSTGTSPAMMIPGILTYLAMAVWFIWMGIGSIKARRWARALVLVTSWFWLISGAFALILMAFVLPDMYGQMGESGELPEAMAKITLYFTMGFMALFYVILPGLLVVFYGSRHVKATCERKDATERWTDRCPLPVLAVSVATAVCAAWIPMMGLYGWAIPWFGTILTGTAGALVWLVFIVFLVYVSRGMYRLSIEAWWCATLLIVAWGASTVLTFTRIDMVEFYEKMNLPAEQLEIMSQYDLMEKFPIALITGLWVVALLAYQLYIKRYFAGLPGVQNAHPTETSNRSES
jgi:hypothetical protein